MASAWLIQFSQQYGLECSPTGNVFGNVGGYFASVFEKGNLIIINFSYFVDGVNRKKTNAISLKMQEDTTISTLSGDFSVSLNGASIRLPNNTQAQSVVYGLIAKYTELFKELEILPEKEPDPVAPAPIEEPKAEEPKEPEEVITEHTTNFEYNYTNPDFNDEIYKSLMPSSKKKVVPSIPHYSGILSVLRGFSGALLGAFIGSIPWIICLALNIFTEILFFVALPIAFCAGMGYRLAHGASDSVFTSAAVVISIFAAELLPMYLFFSGQVTEAEYMLAFMTGTYSSIGILNVSFKPLNFTE